MLLPDKIEHTHFSGQYFLWHHPFYFLAPINIANISAKHFNLHKRKWYGYKICVKTESLQTKIKLIANRWAWGRCPWKRVVVPSKMRASSRACRYPQQPRERQPPPGTVTLRNSVEILTSLYTYHDQPRGRESKGQTAAIMHKYELKIAQPQSEYTSSNAKRRPVCWIGAHDPWTPLTSIGSILT